MSGEALTQAMRYGVPAVAVLVTCTLAGLVVAMPLGGRTGDRAVSGAVGGLSLAIVAATWWAYSEEPVGVVVVGLVICAAVGASVVSYWMYRHRQVGAADRHLVRAAAISLGTIVAAVVLALLQYWPVFSSGFLPDAMTAFKNDNNDIGIYIVQSDNVMHAGFGELGRVATVAAGSWAEADHAGTSAALAIASDFLGRPSWRVTIPFMVAIIALTIMCLAAIARRVGAVGRVAALVAAFWAVTAPLPSAVQADYFLGQSLSRALLFAQVLFVLQAFSSEDGAFRGVLPLALLALTTSAGLLAYPVGQALNIAIVVLVSVCVCASVWFGPGGRNLRQQASVRLASVGASIVVGVLLVAPRWQMILDTTQLYSRPDVAGWRVPTLEFATLAGIGRSQGVWSSIGPWLVGVVLALAAAGLVVCARRSRARLWLLASLVLVPVAGYVLIAWRVGSSSYQTWKFLATAQPLALLGVAVLAVHGGRAAVDTLSRTEARRRAARWLAVVPVAALAVFALSTSQATWRDVTTSREAFATRHVTPALSGIGDDEYVRAQPNLVIALSPHFESIVAAPVGELSGVLRLDERGTGCALVWDADVPDGSPPYHRVGRDLLLGPTTQCVAPSHERPTT